MSVCMLFFVAIDEDTRVALLKSPGVDGSDYINASSIDVSFFLAILPMSRIARQSFAKSALIIG